MIYIAFLFILTLDLMDELVDLGLISVSHNEGIKVASFILATTVVFHHFLVSIDFLLSLRVPPDEERTPIVLIGILEKTSLLILFSFSFLHLFSIA